MPTYVYKGRSVQLVTGDCLTVLRDFADNSIDSIVTDPPAGIGFMGKAWDKDKGGMNKWISWMEDRALQMLRVLKPGGHALVWALPRTSHWTGMALELAGFEVRDRVSHFFGTGFPKSANIAKQIDKAMGVEPTVVGDNPNHRADSGVNYEGIYAGGNTGAANLTTPTSDEAKKWAGWGTALKPAEESWWLIRKPFKGAVYKNVLEHGTGALNIDACRIPTEEKLTRKLGKSTESDSGWKSTNRSEIAGKDGGRWPAHIVFSEDMLGDASRFFYTAKPSKAEKNTGVEKNQHPTVKSVNLMRWLIRLITPPGGTVLDPFCGSGSTGVAALQEGFDFIGIDSNDEYADIAQQRILHQLGGSNG